MKAYKPTGPGIRRSKEKLLTYVLVRQLNLFILSPNLFSQSMRLYRNDRNAPIVEESKVYRVVQIGKAMKTEILNRARRIVITEALIDYMEQFFEENGEAEDILYLVNEHFDDFVHWAYDDIIISNAERDLLLNGHEQQLNEGIKREAAESFSYITDL